MDSTIKIGVIGCGQRLLTVARNLFQDNPLSLRLKITALYDPLPEAVETIRSEVAPDARSFPDVQSLLASDVDWVMVGSWNCFHADQIIAALQAGKHVFAEKPLATTLEDCVRINEALKAAGDREFFFGLVLRYAPIYRKAKEILDSGVVGQIVSLEFNETLDFNHGGYIHGNWRRHRQRAGTHLLEKCCHDFDIVNWLLGSIPIRAASFGGLDIFRPDKKSLASDLKPNVEGRLPYRAWKDPEGVDPFSGGSSIVDNQVAILQYASGARATFHTNCHSALPERRLYILGTKGAMRFDAAASTIEWKSIGFDTKAESISLGQNGMHFGADKVMAEHLARAMVGQAKSLATLHDGLTASVACLGVDEALDRGEVIDLQPFWQRAGVAV
ncbi:MAG: Gfo/Idh/MocA family protein [Candidatus Methylacidiphilales bacterium]|nr:Gfo/Idh/MocA family oxidoreductase [Candidatus Methylacidiphilales bacterium]